MASHGFYILVDCPILHYSMLNHGVCNVESRESEMNCSGIYRDCVPDVDGLEVEGIYDHV